VLEALKVAKQQRIISSTLDPLYVQMRAVQVYKALSASPNRTVIMLRPRRRHRLPQVLTEGKRKVLSKADEQLLEDMETKYMKVAGQPVPDASATPATAPAPATQRRRRRLRLRRHPPRIDSVASRCRSTRDGCERHLLVTEHARRLRRARQALGDRAGTCIQDDRQTRAVLDLGHRPPRGIEVHGVEKPVHDELLLVVGEADRAIRSAGRAIEEPRQRDRPTAIVTEREDRCA